MINVDICNTHATYPNVHEKTWINFAIWKLYDAYNNTPEMSSNDGRFLWPVPIIMLLVSDSYTTLIMVKMVSQASTQTRRRDLRQHAQKQSSLFNRIFFQLTKNKHWSHETTSSTHLQQSHNKQAWSNLPRANIMRRLQSCPPRQISFRGIVQLRGWLTRFLHDQRDWLTPNINKLHTPCRGGGKL